jgi:hypothetical protein
MKKVMEAGFSKAALKRVALLGGILIVATGAVFGVNALMRGSGKHERALAEALLASIGQNYVQAKVDLSQQGQAQSLSLSGALSLQKQDRYKGEMTLEVDSGEDSTKVPLQVIGSASDSELFVQVSNASAVIDAFGAQSGEAKPMLDSIAKKVSDKWLHIPQKESAVTDCNGQLFSALSKDKRAQQEVVDAYVANRFIVVREVKMSGDATTYTATSDKKALRGFFKSLKSKDFFKKQDACNASYDPLGLEAPQQSQTGQSSSAQGESVPVQITVNKQGRISGVNASQRASDGISTLAVEINYKPTDKIALPADNIIEFSSISSEVEQVAGSIARQQQAIGQGQQQLTPGVQ